MRRTHTTATVLLLCSCAGISKERGHDQVAKIVDERIGQKTSWEQGAPEEAQVAARIDEWLKSGLTRERAIDIALVNNRTLRGIYEEIGISQADLVQAGLLRNPSFSGSIGWPLNEGIAENEAAITFDFLDLLILPMRKKIAEQQFNSEVLRVAHETLQVAAELNKAFVDVQSATQLVELRRLVVQTNALSAELAQRLFEAGNINAFNLKSQVAAYEQSKLELAQEELGVIESRERLNQLLGLWGPQTTWNLAGQLPELPPEDPSLDQLEARAIRQRLDIDSARLQVELIAKAVDLARTYRYFGQVEVGIHTHQDADGPRLLGPTLALELPVFDQRQGMIARLEAQQRQAAARLASLSITARSEVRLARAKIANARQVVEHYRRVLLPVREEVVEQAQLQYNAMQIGLYELLAARQAQIEAYRSYIMSVRDYWNAVADMERVLGGHFPVKRMPPKAEPRPSQPSEHQHHE